MNINKQVIVTLRSGVNVVIAHYCRVFPLVVNCIYTIISMEQFGGLSCLHCGQPYILIFGLAIDSYNQMVKMGNNIGLVYSEPVYYGHLGTNQNV